MRCTALLIFCLLPLIIYSQRTNLPGHSFPLRTNDYYQGFQTIVSGTELDYPPVLQEGKLALIADASGDPIVFKTAPLPNNSQEQISFIWQASFNKVKGQQATAFDVFLNGKKYFGFYGMQDEGDENWLLKNGAYEWAFVTTQAIDEHGNFLGYNFLTIPAEDFEEGKPIEIKIQAQQASHLHHYIAYQNVVQKSLEVQSLQLLKQINGAPHQAVLVEIEHVAKTATASIFLDGSLLEEISLHPGFNQYQFWIPQIKVERSAALEIKFKDGGQNIARQNVALKKVRPFEVYLLPHSHVDIGFTHHQDTVAKMQWRNFEQGIELAKQTADYPEGSRYKWNVEVLWAVDGYLKNAPEESRKAFIEAVKKGWIGLDALYGSELTGLQRPEELMRLTGFANKMERDYGIKIQSAMITDVPGYAWGIVPALAESEVKYFSIGPNHMPHKAHGGYQVGHTFEAWGDVPFYWASPDGKDKVLFWMSRHGYSWFHDWLLGKLRRKGGLPIVKFLGELTVEDYPYELVQIRYTLGDNSGPDLDMPDFVKSWNENHLSPKLRIATTAEMFEAFEEQYGAQLPTHTGDFTPYWEDGAASSALETAMNRQTTEQLVQAETLWAMLHPSNEFPAAEFDEAWTNVLLFSEHTWGAVTSKSDPNTEFTTQQWAVKKSFAEQANRQANRLIERATEAVKGSEAVIESFLLFNTTSWQRSELISIPAGWDLEGKTVWDNKGNELVSQKLSSGELAFYAEALPPFSATKYYLKAPSNQLSNQSNLAITPNSITNGRLKVSVNEEDGSIESIRMEKDGLNFVDPADEYGFNEYWYSGKNAENPQKSAKAKITIKENGPLVASLLIESTAPGAHALSRELILTATMDRLDIVNLVDKKKVYEDENVRFSFPFKVPDGKTKIDLAWAIMEPEKDQLKGANKNFFCAQHFVDISNEHQGVTWANVDAPIVETGEMIGQEWMGDLDNEPWRKTWTPSQRLFSWVMNNVWFVNYKGHQEGPVSFRYVLQPHGGFVSSDAKKFGIGLSQPAILMPVSKSQAGLESLFEIKGSDTVIVSSLRPLRTGEGYFIRLFNASDKAASVQLFKKGKAVENMFITNQKERIGKKADAQLQFAPWEIQTYLIEN